MIRSLVLPALIAPALIVVAPATAAAQDSHSVTVSISGIDLRSAAGEAELDRRISRAVTQLCRVAGTRDLGARLAESECQRTAHASAAPQVASAVAYARTGKRLASNGVTVSAR